MTDYVYIPELWRAVFGQSAQGLTISRFRPDIFSNAITNLA
jgi:hypothetical protein